MADFRALCATVLAYNEGRDEYNFSHLEDYDRDNAAFDAWQKIKAELKSALSQPEPEGPQPIPVSERLPGPDLCWWFTPESDEEYGWWVLETYGMEREPQPTHWLPAHALPIPRSEND
jgi:hypothetical protein